MPGSRAGAADWIVAAVVGVIGCRSPFRGEVCPPIVRVRVARLTVKRGGPRLKSACLYLTSDIHPAAEPFLYDHCAYKNAQALALVAVYLCIVDN